MNQFSNYNHFNVHSLINKRNIRDNFNLHSSYLYNYNNWMHLLGTLSRVANSGINLKGIFEKKIFSF